jgi:hypothetical protein
MVTYHQMVVVARIIRGLCAGRNGEDLIAEVRALPVSDPTPLLKTVTLVVILTAATFGFGKVAKHDDSSNTAAVHDIRASTDL